MSGETISGTYQTGSSLTNSEATLTSTAVIDAPSSDYGVTFGGARFSDFFQSATIVNSGYVMAKIAAISIYGEATITNSGTLRSSGDAVDSYGLLTLTNLAGGVIVGSNGLEVGSNYGQPEFYVTNAGVIAGTTGVGLGNNFRNLITVDNLDGGTISGAATVSNGKPAGGIYCLFDGYANVMNSGLITGYFGIQADGLVIDNLASGTITGSHPISGVMDSELTNFGTIVTAPGVASAAVMFTDSSTITNEANAIIEGGDVGVYVTTPESRADITIVNYGTIGGRDTGIHAYGNGTIINKAGALLKTDSSMGNAINEIIQSGFGNIILNQGSIEGNINVSGYAILAAHISQSSTGTLSGGITVNNVRATIDLAGTVTDGITLAGSLANTLTLEPGVVIDGAIALGTDSLTSVILNAGAQAGTLYFGTATGDIDFTTVPKNLTFATGAHWDLAGDATQLTDGVGSQGVTLTGFAVGDTIAVQDNQTFILTEDGTVNGQLDLNTGTATTTIAVGGSLDEGGFVIRDIAAATAGAPSIVEFAPCFAAGTRILTPLGDRAVQDLRAGDLVITAAGDDAPIIWIGRRHLNLHRHPAPARVQPIRIRAGALGDGTPARDLLVSPEHAMFLEQALIPARHLVNHSSIVRMEVAEVTYFHIELATHSLVFAEGAATESYLECGGRAAFEDGGILIDLHPDFASGLRINGSCAPVVEAGPVLNAARAMIAGRLGGGGRTRLRA